MTIYLLNCARARFSDFSDKTARANPIVSDNGDAGLAGALAKLDENWKHAKTQLGINNPQPYATWFSLLLELP